MTDTLQRSVEVPVAPAEAWPVVADPAWLGEDGSIDLRPGGEGWVDDGGDTRFLVVEEVDEPRRLAYRWATFVEEPTRVEIELAPTATGTRITVTESPLRAPRAQLLAA